MNAAVQFIRNALCCIKDLELYRDSVLYDAKSLRSVHGYDYPPYTEKTTPLEALISIAQLYVFVTGVPSALSLLWYSVGKLQRIQRILERKYRRQPVVTTTTNDSGGHDKMKLAVEKLMLQSLWKEATVALQSVFIGFNVFFISLAFLWLAANSWHVTETAEILGGLPALIHALTVMEVCLLPLLYYMIKDANSMLRRANAYETAEIHWRKRHLIVEKEVTLPVFEALTKHNWTPFWHAGVSPVWWYSTKNLIQREQADWQREGQIVQQCLDEISGAHFHQSAAAAAASSTSMKKRDDDGQKQQLLLAQHAHEMADRLYVQKRLVRWEGYREYFLFLVNLVAWYGYGVCILVYYYYPNNNNDETESSSPPSPPPQWLRWILSLAAGGIGHRVVDDPALSSLPAAAVLDWRGNFAGDLMWTIEPLIVLLSPYYLARLQRSIQSSQQQQQQVEKTKAD